MYLLYIYILFYSHIIILTWCDFYALNSQSYLKKIVWIVSHVTVVKKTPNKVKCTTTKAISHLYSWKCSSPITCLSVYAINQCWCHVKLQKHKFKFAQFNYPYFKTKHDIVYIYRKIVPQVHVTGPAMHKYEMLFF